MGPRRANRLSLDHAQKCTFKSRPLWTLAKGSTLAHVSCHPGPVAVPCALTPYPRTISWCSIQEGEGKEKGERRRGEDWEEGENKVGKIVQEEKINSKEERERESQ